MTQIIILLAAILVGAGAHFISKKNDSPIEQLAEQVIQNQSGIDVDFSKDSKKKDEKSKEK